MHFFCIFLAKNFADSKKCCNFAPEFETAPRISPAKVQNFSGLTTKKITYLIQKPFFMKDFLFFEHRGMTAIVNSAIVVALYWLFWDGYLSTPLVHWLCTAVLFGCAAVACTCLILYLEDER